jgi:hypothetical protein
LLKEKISFVTDPKLKAKPFTRRTSSRVISDFMIQTVWERAQAELGIRLKTNSI